MPTLYMRNGRIRLSEERVVATLLYSVAGGEVRYCRDCAGDYLLPDSDRSRPFRSGSRLEPGLCTLCLRPVIVVVIPAWELLARLRVKAHSGVSAMDSVHHMSDLMAFVVPEMP